MSKEYIVRGLHHIGIMTDDPKKCAQFYIDNLGFRPYYTMAMGPMTIEFVELGGMVIEFVGSGARDVHGIVDHIAIEVQNIEALVAELKAKGIAMGERENRRHAQLLPQRLQEHLLPGPRGASASSCSTTPGKLCILQRPGQAAGALYPYWRGAAAAPRSAGDILSP